MVVHQFVRTVEESAGADFVVLPIDGRSVEDHRTTEGAVHACEVLATDGVLEHLVPSHDTLGICTFLPIDRDAEHDVVIVQVSGPTCVGESRQVERWNPVAHHASPPDFVETDVRGQAIVEVVTKARVDGRVQPRLEHRVVGMHSGIGCPDPIPPPIHVSPERLSGGALQQQKEASPIAPLGEALELDEHGGIGIVPSVQNCSLQNHLLLGIHVKEVEERLDVRPLGSKGRGYQEQEYERRSGDHG